jgi:ribosomal protein S18 acetylase RimI-like enzyme
MSDVDADRVTVRRARPDDAAAWRELRLRALADAPTAFGSTLEREQGWAPDIYAERLAAGNSVLAFAGDLPIGLGAGFEHPVGWFRVVSIWVDPDFRRRGANRLILGELVSRAHELGLRVHLDVTRGNDVARRAYERSGFVGTGESQPLREGSPYVAERMVLVPGRSRRG